MYQTFEEMGLDEGIIRGLTANGVTVHMINAKLTQHQAVIRNSGISVPDFIADAYYLLLKYGKQVVSEPLPFDDLPEYTYSGYEFPAPVWTPLPKNDKPQAIED